MAVFKNGRRRQRKNFRLTMAQAVVCYLSNQYSERDGKTQRLIPAMFGIFGHGNVAGLGQALEEYGEQLPYMQPFNEQSMVHTASGFAKATLRKQLLACTASIGPGSTNMLTGAATATINRLPVLLLPSDYYATRHQGPVLQQLEHPVSADISVNDAFRPLSRFFDRITRPEQLLTALPEAMRVLTDPADTGAVTIALPQDVQAHAYDYPAYFFEKRIWRIERRLPDAKRIEEATALIRRAKHPAIIAGGGVHYAEAYGQLQKFADTFAIPVGETFGGKGAMSKDSPMVLGGHGVTGGSAAAEVMSKADLVIAVGTRLTDFTTGSQSCFKNPDVQFISINVTGHDAFKQGALPIVADAREAISALHKKVRAARLRRNPSHEKLVAQAKERWQITTDTEAFTTADGEAMSQGHLVSILNDEARKGDTIVAAAGSPPGDLHKLWDATAGAFCHIEFGFSCMAYEIPAGLGVRMAQRDGEVFVYIGDGTYMMNPTELATAVQEGLKITVVISENHGYQCIRQLQMGRTGRDFGNEFRSRSKKSNQLDGKFIEIDLAKNAESFGARAWNCQTEDEVRAALRESRNEPGPCVIVVETEKYRYTPWSEVWWDVAPAESTGDPATRRIRKEYERDRSKLQRLHY